MQDQNETYTTTLGDLPPQHRGGYSFFEEAVVPPGDLERLGPAEIELNVELDGEPDPAENLLCGGGHIPKSLAGK